MADTTLKSDMPPWTLYWKLTLMKPSYKCEVVPLMNSLHWQVQGALTACTKANTPPRGSEEHFIKEDMYLHSRIRLGVNDGRTGERTGGDSEYKM